MRLEVRTHWQVYSRDKEQMLYLGPRSGEGVVGNQFGKGHWNQVLEDFARLRSLDLNSK